MPFQTSSSSRNPLGALHDEFNPMPYSSSPNVSSPTPSFSRQASAMSIDRDESSTVDDNDTESVSNSISESQHDSSIKETSFIFKYGYGQRFTDDKGAPRIKYLVGNCNSSFALKDSSTSGLDKHLQNKHQITADNGPHTGAKRPGGPMDLFVQAKRPRVFTADDFIKTFIKFIVKTKLSFTMTENDNLQELLNIAQSVTVMEMVKLLSTDTITRKTKEDPYNDAFLAVTGHWISTSTWTMHEVILGFQPLNGPHSAENLAASFLEIINDFNLGPKLFTITTDNASNMKRMALEIEKYAEEKGWPFRTKTHHIPCLGHVLNLAVQDILKWGMNESYVEQENDDDSERANEHDRFGDNGERQVMSSLVKLRKGITKIRSSPQRTERFMRAQEIHCATKLKLSLDVPTRWNSTYQIQMLTWAFLLQVPYSSVKSMLLKFWETTIELSASQSHATINTTIVHYNLIMDSLEDVESSDYPAKLKRAGCMGDFPKSVTIESEANEELRRLYSLYNISNEHDEHDDYLQERLRVPMLRKKVQKAPEFLYWEAQSRWPNLARMAAQYFAVPVTSTPSERCFSQTRLLLPYTRNSLSPETIQRLMLLDS
ncbi:hypothetical protein INT45_010286 [Circinella minor]|uniref:HAT C-terminal dimerisation domain-containing protein n=1 Tax=Circinella minor TaxID=1195481 RepID=A0A8H7RUM8_9FUNG|nr:hypothetical protein INT45_010286 [Circinella minor]